MCVRVCVCVCVCVRVCVRVCVCACVCLCVYGLCVHLLLCVRLRSRARAYVCMSIRIFPFSLHPLRPPPPTSVPHPTPQKKRKKEKRKRKKKKTQKEDEKGRTKNWSEPNAVQCTQRNIFVSNGDSSNHLFQARHSFTRSGREIKPNPPRRQCLSRYLLSLSCRPEPRTLETRRARKHQNNRKKK